MFARIQNIDADLRVNKNSFNTSSAGVSFAQRIA